MSKEPDAPKTDLNNELITVLKGLQSELQIYKIKQFSGIYEKLEPQLTDKKALTDNPKFNEFITKFTNDPKVLNNADSQAIANKLMIAFLYINTD